MATDIEMGTIASASGTACSLTPARSAVTAESTSVGKIDSALAEEGEAVPLEEPPIEAAPEAGGHHPPDISDELGGECLSTKPLLPNLTVLTNTPGN